jgi:hypothetical protein
MNSPLISAAEAALENHDAVTAKELAADPARILLALEEEISYIEAGYGDQAELAKLNGYRETLIPALETEGERPALDSVEAEAPGELAAIGADAPSHSL